MVCARRSHVVVSGNLFNILKNHLRGGPCTVFMADMKVRVAAEDLLELRARSDDAGQHDVLHHHGVQHRW